MKTMVFRWYFALHIVLAVACGAMLLTLIRGLQPRLQRLALATWTSVGALVIIAVFNGIYLHWALSPTRRDFQRSYFETAMWLRGNVPSNAILAVPDAGIIGYYSGRPTINLDGLINNFDYERAWREGRLVEYLKENRVDYVCAEVRESELRPGYARARLMANIAHDIDPTLFREDNEVYRNRQGEHGFATVVWRMPFGKAPPTPEPASP